MFMSITTIIIGFFFNNDRAYNLRDRKLKLNIKALILISFTKLWPCVKYSIYQVKNIKLCYLFLENILINYFFFFSSSIFGLKKRRVLKEFRDVYTYICACLCIHVETQVKHAHASAHGHT